MLRELFRAHFNALWARQETSALLSADSGERLVEGNAWSHNGLGFLRVCKEVAADVYGFTLYRVQFINDLLLVIG
jgi:hypothetical protein